MKTNKIKPESTVKGTLIKDSHLNDSIENKKVCFSFEVFKGNSIRISDFNNYYLTVENSRNAVADFFDIIQKMSSLTIKELFELSNKKEFHFNFLKDDYLVDRIENVLINGYLFPKRKVEQFEKEYFEFQISDGKRVMCHKVDNVIYPLFIDCNHMICKESSRDLKSKLKYSINSSFSRQTQDDLSSKDMDMKAVIRYIVDESDELDFKKEDIISILKEFL